MKLEKYEDKNKKKRKIILISIGVIVLISLSLILYKTFASFSEEVSFPMMKGKVDYFGNSDIYFAFYKDDELLEEMPQKDNKENLVFDHGECDNGASIEWNNDEWAPLIKELNKVKTKCNLYFKKAINAVEYFTELAKTDTTNLKTDDTSEANIRYVGANPNNYIDIGDKDSYGKPILWRIIGVMNNITNLDNGVQQESLVKIIRTGIIGGYSWDTSLSEINSGFGINEWSQADAMKLLNPDTVYSGTSEIGGSLYWKRESGNCYSDEKQANKTCDFTSSGLSEEAKKKIAKIRWNTGTKEEIYDANKITAKYMYEGERSNHNGKEQCKNASSGECNDEVPRTTTWDGYIGLMYPSDYGYAVGGEVRDTCLGMSMNSYNSEDCGTNDWLKPGGSSSYFLTPMSSSTSSNRVFHVSSTGYVGIGHCHIARWIIPVVYLKKNAKITGGTGDKNTPFTLVV